MPNNVSFIANVNKLVDKLPVVENAVDIFDEGVIPILREITELDLTDAIQDLRKGNYLGNRKLDINLSLNVPGVTQSLIDTDIATGTNVVRDIVIAAGDNLPKYDRATVSFIDGTIIEHPFLNTNGTPSVVSNIVGLFTQLQRKDNLIAVTQVDRIVNIVPVAYTLYTLVINGDTFSHISSGTPTAYNISVSLNQLIGTRTDVDVTVDTGGGLTITSLIPGVPFTTSLELPMRVQDAQYDRTLIAFKASDSTDYTVAIHIDNTIETYTYTSGVDTTVALITQGLVASINSGSTTVTTTTDDTNVHISSVDFEKVYQVVVSMNMEHTREVENAVEDIVNTALINKIKNTNITVTTYIPDDMIRFYDVLGSNSNIERIELYRSSGDSISDSLLLYWGLTTSALQIIASRSGDIIKLGNELDNLLLLSTSIEALAELQTRIPQLVDTYTNDIPNNDITIFNKLNELMSVYSTITEIVTLYSIREDISTVADNEDDIQLLAYDFNLGVNSHIKKVSNNMPDVLTVSNNILMVNTLHDNINTLVAVHNELPEITSVADNMSAVLAAEGHAQTATDKAAEIQNVTVGATVTGVPGTPALVIYSPPSGEFAFVIPEGEKGDRGEAFTVNAIGNDITLYDSQGQGFSFLNLVNSKIYFKQTAAVGDWSVGAPFGKGDKGDSGDIGVGILSVTATSTTNPGDVYATTGYVDTYTITYTDSTVSTFNVANGIDSVQIDDTESNTDRTYSSDFIDGRIGLSELVSDGITTGLELISTGLNGVISAGAAVIKGHRVGGIGLSTHAYTEDKITYVDLNKFRAYTYTETVANRAQVDSISIPTLTYDVEYKVTINGVDSTYTPTAATPEVNKIVISQVTTSSSYGVDINNGEYTVVAVVGETPSDVMIKLVTEIGSAATYNSLEGAIILTATVPGEVQSILVASSTTTQSDMSITLVTANTSTDTIGSTLLELFNGVTDPSIDKVINSTVLTFTANVLGDPFTISANTQIALLSVVSNVSAPTAPVIDNNSIRLLKVTTDNTQVIEAIAITTDVIYGNAQRPFKVADAVEDDEALNKGQLDGELVGVVVNIATNTTNIATNTTNIATNTTNIATNTTNIATKANESGDNLIPFSVGTATEDEHAVTLAQLNAVALSSATNNASWVDETANRVAGVTYTNSSSKTIIVFISASNSVNASIYYDMTMVHNGVTMVFHWGGISVNNANNHTSREFTIPNGATYKHTITYNYIGIESITNWFELKE